jgi:glycosyltransferase involved in cell wall biosynthesis
MKNITLAIPFYNTSQYFTECIKYAIDDDFVSEIVVNDDGSNEYHLQNLNEIINTLNSSKIKLFRNQVNLGAFRNKYITIQNCTNDWIYMLDSDNHPFEETYQVIRTIPDVNPLICYSPRQLFCKNDDKVDYELISDYTFRYDTVGIEESKDALIKQTKWFGWFLNSGNYVFNRQTYLDFLKEPFEDTSIPLLHADTAAAYYFWLKNGGEFKVVNKLRHNHRLRSDSNWNACGGNSQQSVDYYQNLILDL